MSIKTQMNFHLREAKYFDGKVSHGFISLFVNKAITSIASGFFSIFLPIYLYIVFDLNIYCVVLYYIISQLLYGIFVVFGARFLNKFGFRRSLQTSMFLGALYYLELYFLNERTAPYIIPLLLVTITLWRMLYWIPYHVDFAKFSDKKNRGKEVGVIESALSVIGIAAPVVAGFIISKFGYNALFVLGIIIYLSSVIPLLTIPRTRERFSWSYAETFRQFFRKENRFEVFAFIASGAESAVGVVIWPIFIFQVLNGNFLRIGAITSLVVGVIVLLQLFAGKYTDKKVKEKVLKFGSVFYALGWLFKIFIVTAFHIFIIDAFHKLTKIFLRIPFDALAYDIAADQGHYVDEFTVLREIAICLGRIIMYTLVVVLIMTISLNWAFALAALASIALNVLHYQKNIKLHRMPRRR
ncbi:MAG: MFS transporter [Patescibacteria group bacterium]|nr:MFS transporter [Patescibacteria group bacterium]